jgi:hypothetical protein
MKPGRSFNSLRCLNPHLRRRRDDTVPVAGGDSLLTTKGNGSPCCTRPRFRRSAVRRAGDRQQRLPLRQQARQLTIAISPRSWAGFDMVAGSPEPAFASYTIAAPKSSRTRGRAHPLDAVQSDRWPAIRPLGKHAFYTNLVARESTQCSRCLLSRTLFADMVNHLFVLDWPTRRYPCPLRSSHISWARRSQSNSG